MEQKTQPREERILRIFSVDIEGKKKVYAGLTRIKGVSWAMSNAICRALKIDKTRTIGSLSEEEIKKTSNLLENPDKIPSFLLNRKKEFETGKNRHLIGSDLNLQREFDIKRMKKIRSYKGIRHSSGQPVRGQRTKSHFRQNKRKAIGVKIKKK